MGLVDLVPLLPAKHPMVSLCFFPRRTALTFPEVSLG